MGVFAEIRNAFECFCKCNIFVWEIDKIGYTRVVSEQIGYLFFRDGARLRNLPVVCGIFRVGLR